MVYKWYILPIGWLYITYHLLREPETATDDSAADRNKPTWQWYGSVSPTLFPLNLVGDISKRIFQRLSPKKCLRYFSLVKFSVYLGTSVPSGQHFPNIIGFPPLSETNSNGIWIPQNFETPRHEGWTLERKVPGFQKEFTMQWYGLAWIYQWQMNGLAWDSLLKM